MAVKNGFEKKWIGSKKSTRILSTRTKIQLKNWLTVDPIGFIEAFVALQ